MWTHWVLRTNQPHEPFRNFDVARAAWTLLHGLFPDMLAGILMPNHLHLVLLQSDHDAPKRLQVFARAVSKRHGVTALWQPVPNPTSFADRGYLRRTVRYVALNPCRWGLCRDPLEWYWSTYREAIGASADELRSNARLAHAMAGQESGFKEWFYRYVSEDESVRMEPRPLPVRALPVEYSEHSLRDIWAAAAAALRQPMLNVQQRGTLRPLFIHLAVRQGWSRPGLLAQVCGTTPRAVSRAMLMAPPPSMMAAELCLGDARLRSAAFWDGRLQTRRSAPSGR